MAHHIRNQKFIGFENGQSRYIAEIDCDTPADLPEPETRWLMGSIAHVISTGDFYELNSSGEWVNQTGEDAETESVSNLNSVNLTKLPDALTIVNPADELTENPEETEEEVTADDKLS